MASQNVGSIHYDLDLNTSAFDKAMSGLHGNLDKIGSKMTSVGKTMTVGLTLPIVAGAGMAIKAASDLNETINKVDVAFKSQAESVKQWASTSIKSMGLAKASALEAASLFGDMSTAMGLSEKEAAKMSTSLVQLGADLASFKNISFAEAQTALAGVFTGETESLKRLGIIMTETNLLEFAKAQGIKKTVQEMTQAEKVNLRYAYVMSVTKNAQGDFNRTSDGTANQMRMTSERVKEMSAEIGAKLLPIAGKMLKWANDMLDKFNALTPGQQKFLGIVLLIAAALGPLLMVIGTLVSLLASLATVATALGVSMGGLILIIGGVGLAIVALIAVGYLIMTHWQTIKDFFVQVWWAIQAAVDAFVNWLKNNWPLVLGILTGPFGLMVAMIVKHWDAVLAFIKSIPGKIGSFFSGIGDTLYNFGRDLINGFLRGAGSLLSTIGQFFLNKLPGWIQTPFKKALGIASPSKVFAGFGKNIVQGLASGISDAESLALNAVNNMSSMVMKPTVSPLMTQPVSRSSMPGSTTINIGTIQNQSDADYIFRRMNRDQQRVNLGVSPAY